jgi:hypothetical protein
MATAYPGGIDDFTNPTSTDTLNSISVPHASQHADLNDAVEAIEATLGVNPQGSESTVSARVGALEATVDTATTGLVDRVEELEEIGLSPLGGDLALNIAQVTAEAADEVDAEDVDDDAVAVYFKFTVDSVEYAVPAYAIILPE